MTVLPLDITWPSPAEYNRARADHDTARARARSLLNRKPLSEYKDPIRRTVRQAVMQLGFAMHVGIDGVTVHSKLSDHAWSCVLSAVMLAGHKRGFRVYVHEDLSAADAFHFSVRVVSPDCPAALKVEPLVKHLIKDGQADLLNYIGFPIPEKL
jgi:hypothetical protein